MRGEQQALLLTNQTAKPMKKYLFALLLCPAALAAQNLHLAARIGLSNYQGDLQSKGFTLSQSKLAGSVGALYDISEKISARSFITLASLQADDKKGSTEMQLRNLNFATKVFDWEIGLQYNFFSLNDKWWTPYVFAGAGLAHFNPYTRAADGSKAYLQPLSTEGEGFIDGVKNYKLTQFSVPFGLGAKYAVNEDMRVGLEFGYRKLFTDYLDDVSGSYVDEDALRNARGQVAVDLAYRGDEVGAGPYPADKTPRGTSKYKDSYYYVALTFSIRMMDTYKRIAGLPAYKRDKKVGCPANRY